MTYITKYKDNQILDVQFDETEVVEFLTLTQLKAHLQITFDDDDTYLTDLITSCRQALEQYCCISLVKKTVSIIGDYYCERELPYGPVQSFTSATLRGSNNIYDLQTADEGYQIDGLDNGFKIFRPLSVGRYKLVYVAGYLTAKVPKDLILDLKRICSYCYEHKGDEALTTLQGGMERPKGLDEALELFASKHRRTQWL